MPHAETDRRAATLALLVLAGAAWGWFSQIGGDFELAQWFTSLGAPWLLVAFGAGAVAPDRRTALLAGALVTVAGVAAYYASMLVLTDGNGLRYAAKIGFAWSTVGVFAGALFAYTGALWRSNRGWPGAVAAAVPFAVLAGEVLALQGVWWMTGAKAALMVELTVAAALLAALAPRDRRVILTGAVALGLTVACGAMEADVRDALRAAGWAGA